MTKQEQLTIFSKIYLSVLFAEGQMHLVRDSVRQKLKERLNHALESVIFTCKTFEAGLDNESLAFAEDDVELLSNFFNLAILCEQKDKINELKNDLSNLFKKYLD